MQVIFLIFLLLSGGNDRTAFCSLLSLAAACRHYIKCLWHKVKFKVLSICIAMLKRPHCIKTVLSLIPVRIQRRPLMSWHQSENKDPLGWQVAGTLLSLCFFCVNNVCLPSCLPSARHPAATEPMTTRLLSLPATLMKPHHVGQLVLPGRASRAEQSFWKEQVARKALLRQ